MDTDKLWNKITGKIKSQISTGTFNTFFKGTSIKQLTDESITLATPSAFHEASIKARFLPILEEIIEQVVDKKLVLSFVVNSLRLTKKEAETTTEEEFFQPAHIDRQIINPKYTLENFVVGLSNNVAYAAAQAVASNPGTSYNPLFVYGGTGVGKTHLMLGIGNAILANKPHFKVIYCSSEKFTNDYVEAIQIRKMGDLRSKYRRADLLLVDDVQFFSGREQTQEEFFHTFNELMGKNSQIVLTSDRPPGEMPKLEDRLKSRFQGGLMVDIQQPGLDTRVAILRAKCLERGEIIPDESLNLIAQSLESNARELEGKLIQIIQHLKTQSLPPTPEAISNLLGQKTQGQALKVNYKQVFSVLCNYFNVKLGDLTGPKRNKDLVLPRHLAMYILSEELQLTVEKIGQLLGGRDHTTVMHGRDRIKGLLDTDREVQRLFVEVRQNITG